jgi:glycine cleavage system H protein
MELPQDLRYTEEHEWARIEDGLARVGITEYAQDQLGDVVYVELPKPGDFVTAQKAFGVVESVKAASDLFSPLTGEIVEVNALLNDQPELVNSDPYGEGWMVVIRIDDESELEGLLDPDRYAELF